MQFTSRSASPAYRNKHFVRYASSSLSKTPTTGLGRCASAPTIRTKEDLGLTSVKAVSFASALQGDELVPMKQDRPSTAPQQRSFSTAGRRLRRVWSTHEQDMLATLDSNCKFLQEKSVTTQMPSFGDEEFQRKFSNLGMKQRTTTVSSAQLFVFTKNRMRMRRKTAKDGYEEKPLEEAVARLKDMQAASTTQEQALELGGIVGELQAGVCSVLFGPGDVLERQVTLHALRLVRSGSHVLTQLGRWKLRHGLKAACGYPGSKRPDVHDFDAFIDSIIRDVEPVLGGGTAVRSGSKVQEYTHESHHYHVRTKYSRLLQLAELDLESPAGHRMHMAPEVAVKEFPASSPPIVIAGHEMHDPVVVIMGCTGEAMMYSWIPCFVSDQIHTSSAIMHSLEEWVGGYADEVDEWCKSCDVLSS